MTFKDFIYNDPDQLKESVIEPETEHIGSVEISETPLSRKYRLAIGYTDIVEINASLFQKLFEESHNESLVHTPVRIERISKAKELDAYPLVYEGVNGVDVLDGRHRIAYAAQTGKTISVAVPKEYPLPEEVMINKSVYTVKEVYMGYNGGAKTYPLIFTDEESFALNEGKVVSTSNIYFKKPLVEDFSGGVFDYSKVSYAMSNGYDGLIALNVKDSFGVSTKYVCFDSGSVQSIGDSIVNESFSLPYENLIVEDIDGSSLDIEYMDAVERGDMNAAQKMVAAAAHKAGYNSPVLYHGSPDTGIKRFNTSSIFLTTDEEVSTGYAKETGRKYKLKVKFDNPLTVYANNYWNDIRPEVEFLKRYRIIDEEGETVVDGIEYETDAKTFALDYAYDKYSEENPNLDIDDVVPYTVEEYYDNEDVTTDMLFRMAMDEGHDGVVLERVIDAADDDGMFHTDVYIASSPNQIKSADPITRDDNGEVIPLSKRFNPQSDDIRESVEYYKQWLMEHRDVEV